MDKEAILDIPLSTHSQADCWAWHHERKGTFSVRSAYRLLSATKQQWTDWLEHVPGHSDCEADRRSWGKLWRLSILSKIKVFTWRLARTSIPTGEIQNHRKKADSPACTICNATVDTWRHSLFDCHMSRCVWALAEEELTEVAISNRTEDARLWIVWLIDTLLEKELTQILVTMWAIWWVTRRAIHDDQYQSPLSTSGFITKFLEDLDSVALSKPRPPKELHVKPKDLHVTPGNARTRATRSLWLPPTGYD